MGVFKNRAKTTKMDGENNGSNPIKMDDLGSFPIIFGSTPLNTSSPGVWKPRVCSFQGRSSMIRRNSRSLRPGLRSSPQ